MVRHFRYGFVLVVLCSFFVACGGGGGGGGGTAEHPPSGSFSVVDRVSKNISAKDGGEISVSAMDSIYSNGLQITIPPGALSADTIIVVGDGSPVGIILGDGEVPLGLPISLKPDGLIFQKPITIRIPYKDSILSNLGISTLKYISLKTFNESLNQWETIPIAGIDDVNHQIIANVNHFSLDWLWAWFDNPPETNIITDENRKNLIEKITGTVITADNFRKIIDPENILIPDISVPMSYINVIDGILVGFKMREEFNNNDYESAIQTGQKYLIKKIPSLALQAAGYTFMSGIYGLYSGAYYTAIELGLQLNEDKINKHIAAYVNLKRCEYRGIALDDYYNLDTGWLEYTISAFKADGTGCNNIWLGNTLGAPVTCDKEPKNPICLDISPKEVYGFAENIYQVLNNSDIGKDEDLLATALKQEIDKINNYTGPEAKFEISPDVAGEAPYTITADGSFSKVSSGFNINSYQWDFGDKSSLTGKIVNHTYQYPGNYLLTLQITDDNNKIGRSTQTINVTARSLTNIPPNANFNFSIDTVHPGVVKFDASTSYDPDGTIREYVWSFGDGNKQRGLAVTNVYSYSGTYTVGLTVSDDQYATNMVRKQVTVDVPKASGDTPPVPLFSMSSGSDVANQNQSLNITVQSGGTAQVNFNGTISYDSDGTVVVHKWYVNGTQVSSNSSFSFMFGKGIHLIHLIVTDDSGMISSVGGSVNITETSNIPEGTLSVSPTGGLTSSGPVGGPFSTTSVSYTLTNPGGASINWTANKEKSWVTLSSSGGTLAAGATATVTVSINSDANSLTAGSYIDTVYFTNTTNNIGNATRPVSLIVLPSVPIIPPAPQNLVATGGNGQVSLTWNSVSGATTYNIYWGTSPGVTANKIPGIATNSYVHTSLTNGNTYYYVVKAENSEGEGSPSSEVSATPVPGGSIQATWGVQFGTAIGEDVALDSQGNIYVVGGLYVANPGAGAGDIFILKYDSQGNLLWNKAWGTTGQEAGPKLAIDKNNDHLYIAIQMDTTPDGGEVGIVLMKLDKDGNPLWPTPKKIGNIYETLSDLKIDSSSHIYVAGQIADYMKGVIGGFVLKLDSNGNKLWEKTPSGNGAPPRIALAGTSVYLASLNDLPGGGGGFTIIKLDDQGNWIWTRILSWSAFFEPIAAGADASGNLIVAGYGYDNPELPPSYGALLKIAPSGDFLWEKRWTTTGDVGGPVVGGIDSLKLAIDQGGNIYVGGSAKDVSSASTNDRDAWLLKVDPGGNPISEKLWGGDSEQYYSYEGGYGITVSPSGSAFLVGSVTCPPFNSKTITHSFIDVKGSTSDFSLQVVDGILVIQDFLQGIFFAPTTGQSCNFIQSFLIKYD